MERTESFRGAFLWRLLAAVSTPFVVVSAYLLCIGWLYRGSGHHGTTLVFCIAIACGSWFVLTLPLRRVYRILLLLIYFPLTWALLVPYSLLFIAVVFHAGIA
jgi:hypothetical protein